MKLVQKNIKRVAIGLLSFLVLIILLFLTVNIVAGRGEYKRPVTDGWETGYIFFSVGDSWKSNAVRSITGFKVLFDAEGLGFPRFLSFLMFVSPLIILIKQFVDFNVKGNLKDNLESICFAVSVFLFIMFAVTLPDGVSATVGAYLYLALSVLGAVCCYLSKSQKKA